MFDAEAIYLGASALEDVVKQVRRPQILDIATYGFYTADTSEPHNAISAHRADELFLMPASIHA